ncbi:hypothetical protein N5B55_19975 [Ralstonia pickettii]|uniref:hypothetical protein n=1 Tax=Ralstonia pickettii TaxID=329 RepID=UPI002714ABBB|nr:hypothetical protein [Ralstonia pickettii]WKZ88332.1 hypothetical protein N5B55_19975 [Ralstonia pickettii]
MEIETAKQATTDQSASTNDTVKTRRAKAVSGADPQATSADAAKAGSTSVAESGPKKGRRANGEANPPEASPRQKSKKAKVVRDSFSMPEQDYRKLAELKERCLADGRRVKKSELLRAGIILLASLPAKRLLAAVARVESIKTGRPPKG